MAIYQIRHFLQNSSRFLSVQSRINRNGYNIVFRRLYIIIDRSRAETVYPIAWQKVVCRGKVPVPITIDESEILCMVIFIAYQIVEHHQSVHLPHFRHTVSQSRTYPEDMSVVNAWQTIVRTYKPGNAYNV